MAETLQTSPGGARAGAGRPRKNGIRTSIYVSRDADTLWKGAAIKLGVAQAAIIEMALRQYAERQNLTLEEARDLIDKEEAAP